MAYYNFFRKGSVGRDLFEKTGTGIRSYLTIEDLLRCSEAHGTGLSDGICATYTVPDILQRLDGKYQNRPEHEIDTALSNDFERIVNSYVFKWFMNRDENKYSYLGPPRFHPEELPEIYPLVKTFLRARGSLIPFPVDAERSTETRTATSTSNNIPRNCGKTYVLLGATFSALRSGSNIERDVTAKIKELVKSHFGCLVLHRLLAPWGAQWYYCSLFGDIAPGLSKTLSIRVLDPETGQNLAILLKEDENVVLRLDFPDLDTAN